MIQRSSSRAGKPHAYGWWLVVLFVLSLPLINPWVRGDGVGYYAYARSLVIDHNLRFEKDWRAANPSFQMARMDSSGNILPDQYTRTGHIGNHFSVGPAILWGPVLIVVHGTVLAFDHFGGHISADGYSRPYLVAMALTTAGYGFLGLWLSFCIARTYVGERWAFLATLAIWWASSLPVYMYFNPSWSHAQSAFSVALFLWYWNRTRPARPLGQWILLALSAGLMVNVYYPNAILLLAPATETLVALRGDAADGATRSVPFSRIVGHWIMFGAVLIVAMLPTFITRQIIYGSPFASGYPSVSTWNWTSPVLLQVLFSSDHGLLSWTPILALAVSGLALLWKRDRILSVSLSAIVLVYYYFIASYGDWDGISSFGNRFFVSLTPIFVIGLAAFFAALADWVASQSRAWFAAAALVGVSILWNVGFMFQWGTHLVPARGSISWEQMVHNQFAVVPESMAQNFETYLLRRHSMMQRIEQQDNEHQRAQPSGAVPRQQ
ncbi:MAG: hypothetical protein WA871_14120 [Candidatus Acidiferrales bacterium]